METKTPLKIKSQTYQNCKEIYNFKNSKKKKTVTKILRNIQNI